jgi:hypothetical protein
MVESWYGNSSLSWQDIEAKSRHIQKYRVTRDQARFGRSGVTGFSRPEQGYREKFRREFRAK